MLQRNKHHQLFPSHHLSKIISVWPWPICTTNFDKRQFFCTIIFVVFFCLEDKLNTFSLLSHLHLYDAIGRLRVWESHLDLTTVPSRLLFLVCFLMFLFAKSGQSACYFSCFTFCRRRRSVYNEVLPNFTFSTQFDSLTSFSLLFHVKQSVDDVFTVSHTSPALN